MIYNSAGHHLKDSGAVAVHGGIVYKENELAILFRDGISKRLTARGYKHIVDSDKETLPEYLNRIKPGSGSVLSEIHFNAFEKSSATGIEVIIPDSYDKYDLQLASMIALGLHKITGLTLRNGGTGVINETKSKRGKLGFLRKPGVNVLIELGFISNPSDVKILLANKEAICNMIADCLIIAEDWLT